MKTDFFNKEFNSQNISHAYLFECKPSKKFNEEINNLIKKILCVDKQKTLCFVICAVHASLSMVIPIQIF